MHLSGLYVIYMHAQYACSTCMFLCSLTLYLQVPVYSTTTTKLTNEATRKNTPSILESLSQNSDG